MTEEQHAESLTKELDKMQLFSERLLAHYFTTLYVLGAASGASLLLLVRNYQTITASLEKGSSEIPLLLILTFALLCIGTWSALWLYVNRELWTVRTYMATLERALHTVQGANLKGHDYYSDFIYMDRCLYSAKSRWYKWLNIPVFLLVFATVLLLVFVAVSQAWWPWRRVPQWMGHAPWLVLPLVVIIFGPTILVWRRAQPEKYLTPAHGRTGESEQAGLPPQQDDEQGHTAS